MKIIAANIYSIFLVLILLLISCRENVILPEEYATTINEPIQKNEPNYYTFTINAQNISIDVVNEAKFSTHTSRISISIADYSSGYVTVVVSDKEKNRRFDYFGDEDDVSFTESLTGYIPGSITIRTVNFTGILSIRLKKTF